jgi:GT2 family glycosyltransferase
MPRVSVILTSFNHGKFVEEAIGSVLDQTFDDFELIIWDDASTDDSWNLICQFETLASRLSTPSKKRAIWGLNKAYLGEVGFGSIISPYIHR